MTIKIVCVIGTRPEVIKMASVIQALYKNSFFKLTILATAQHRELLDEALDVFNIKPDIDLNIMFQNQSLGDLTGRLLINLNQTLKELSPDVVLAQGDTTTVMATALCCFYKKIIFGHIEAGLRTGDLQNPFPEEMNRSIVGMIAKWHFAPTEQAFNNLIAEGVCKDNILLSGNTVIDSLYLIEDEPKLSAQLDFSKRLILITVHRRENFGEPIKEICRAVQSILDRHDDVEILFLVHPNPNIKNIVFNTFKSNRRVLLSEPLNYKQFVNVMRRAHFILTDSGGIQEEAPALGKPTLVLRNTSERLEAVNFGSAKLVGHSHDLILKEVDKLLNDKYAYAVMAKKKSLFGDGKSAIRIVDFIESKFKT